ncbi:hypothetical protein GCM10028812_51540 [Ancylobacter sonchi]
MKLNERGPLDFVAGQMTDGRRFRMLAVVGDCTWGSPVLVAGTSLSGRRQSLMLSTVNGSASAPAVQPTRELK